MKAKQEKPFWDELVNPITMFPAIKANDRKPITQDPITYSLKNKYLFND
jgi:hypothetical protein